MVNVRVEPEDQSIPGFAAPMELVATAFNSDGKPLQGVVIEHPVWRHVGRPPFQVDLNGCASLRTVGTTGPDGMLRFHVPTADALKEIMIRARVSTEVEPETVISGATPTK